MSLAEEHIKCENQILADYHAIKESLKKDDVIICQHIGTFNQHILISIISLLDHTLVQNGEYLSIKKRLSYLVIECIHNIIFHSNITSDKNQLAYLLIIKNELGYTIYASNAMETKNIVMLEAKINDLLAIKKSALSNLFKKKIQTPEINENGYAGLGLLTIMDKSGKDFNYKIAKVSQTFALFHLEININYKNYQ
ncbi:MAG: hypothetical protein COX70_06815 [Flavobacteriales bacterium CG_4_10_14_0_2_um_filter_32_8]|nr:MAG: hypothetical protein COX70_06815 [Flavobacteriales bacterium CG_4_10_14_0_2_um_filter_32_8]PJB14608.1 MAG: hypothetical protein CO118_07775 [Flavobacteriales bacterium CG_4_9_14_3_um_filter_32_8]